MLDEDEATAFHEAGHAVADVVSGLRFRYVTVRPRNRSIAGHVMPSNAHAPGIWRSGQWEAVALSSAAGIIAEDLQSTGSVSSDSQREWLRRFFVQQTGRTDMQYLRSTTRYAFVMERSNPGWSATEIEEDETPVDLAKRAWRRAIKVITTNWEAVEEVAWTLLDESPTLSYAQVSSIVAGSELIPEEEVLEALKDPHYWNDWFMSHGRLKWEPSDKWYQDVKESVSHLRSSSGG